MVISISPLDGSGVRIDVLLASWLATLDNAFNRLGVLPEIDEGDYKKAVSVNRVIEAINTFPSNETSLNVVCPFNFPADTRENLR